MKLSGHQQPGLQGCFTKTKHCTPIKYIVMCCCMLMFSASAHAQKREKKQRFETMGFITGFGNSFAGHEEYKVRFFTGDFSRSITKAVKKDFVALYAEPQYNTVTTATGANMEFGMNFGFRNYIRINPGFYIYQMIGSGPHFISAKLQCQARGFIFSDNFFAGIMTRMEKNTFLNFQIGFRHISNATLKQPNGGMNTLNLRIGISGIGGRVIKSFKKGVSAGLR